MLILVDQQNNEDSKQTDANSTEVIQIVIPEDPVHTNIDQQHDELIEDKAQKINQENLMATKPVDNKGTVFYQDLQFVTVV